MLVVMAVRLILSLFTKPSSLISAAYPSSTFAARRKVDRRIEGNTMLKAHYCTCPKCYAVEYTRDNISTSRYCSDTKAIAVPSCTPRDDISLSGERYRITSAPRFDFIILQRIQLSTCLLSSYMLRDGVSNSGDLYCITAALWVEFISQCVQLLTCLSSSYMSRDDVSNSGVTSAPRFDFIILQRIQLSTCLLSSYMLRDGVSNSGDLYCITAALWVEFISQCVQLLTCLSSSYMSRDDVSNSGERYRITASPRIEFVSQRIKPINLALVVVHAWRRRIKFRRALSHHGLTTD
ncbi:hypothetical protein B0H34DRAFT_796358 [Crassisporium funariophilum]|nr:hypothetical protein B0H34DRAFT_796358 [Crassisporium funariophilum]